jgi:hypothetical protein
MAKFCQTDRSLLSELHRMPLKFNNYNEMKTFNPFLSFSTLRLSLRLCLGLCLSLSLTLLISCNTKESRIITVTGEIPAAKLAKPCTTSIYLSILLAPTAPDTTAGIKAKWLKKCCHICWKSKNWDTKLWLNVHLPIWAATRN